MKCASIQCRREALPSSNFCLEHRPAPSPRQDDPRDLRYWVSIWAMRALVFGVLASIVTACGSVGVLAVIGAARVFGHAP